MLWLGINKLQVMKIQQRDGPLRIILSTAQSAKSIYTLSYQT